MPYYLDYNVLICLIPAALDSALMPSMLSLVKREDITPMEVSSNLQPAGVFKVNYCSLASSVTIPFFNIVKM